jgi:hypothetical protein
MDIMYNDFENVVQYPIILTELSTNQSYWPYPIITIGCELVIKPLMWKPKTQNSNKKHIKNTQNRKKKKTHKINETFILNYGIIILSCPSLHSNSCSSTSNSSSPLGTTLMSLVCYSG